jgi:hypothetical protein
MCRFILRQLTPSVRGGRVHGLLLPFGTLLLSFCFVLFVTCGLLRKVRRGYFLHCQINFIIINMDKSKIGSFWVDPKVCLTAFSGD